MRNLSEKTKLQKTAQAPKPLHKPRPKPLTGPAPESLAELPGEIQVEPLFADDTPGVALLEKECFTLPWSEEHIRQALTHQVFQILGIKTKAEQLAAYVSFYHLPGEIEIINIATRPELRRKGLAAALLQTVISEGKSQGAERILLEVRRSNDPAIILYRKFGFAPVGIRRGYYHDTGEDALVLELSLLP